MFILVLIAAVMCGQTPQSPPRDAKPSAAGGTAVLGGRVVDAETGAPIAGAMVNIGMRILTERPTEIETGVRGEFRITGLAAGDYLVIASPPELRPTHLPQILNGDISAFLTAGMKPSLHLNDGEVRDDLVLRLSRAFAIDGTVLDEFGEPMAGVTVNAEAVQASSPFGSVRSQQTDDRGMFRLFGMWPGTYRICAWPTSTDGRPATGEAVQRRYVKSCYPSAPAGGGERVSISGAAATPVLTIVMQRSQGFTITGRAISESGAKAVQVGIDRIGDDHSSSVPIEMQEGGRFIARGVTAGRYNVSARVIAESGEYIVTELARTVVEVTGGDVSGIELVATKGATLRGQIVPAEPLPPGTRLRVQQAVGLPGNSFSGPGRNAQVRADLTFEMTAVHDTVLFDVLGLPAGWVLASVRYRGADVTHTSVPATTNTQPRELEIHISPRSGRILARPVDADGRSIVGALAFVMPAKGDRVSMQSMFSGAKPTDEGFELGPLSPGSYVVVAVAISDMMQVSRDPTRLEQLRQLGRPVEVVAGQRITVDVVVRPLPEVR